ncbi:MAG: hypothetical protein HZA19_00590, partial [Nitrospirae bacterium]|nr:hypothetical protein [Nitrospirota bacterium]
TYGVTGAGKVGPVNITGEVDILGGEASSTSDFKGTNLLLAGDIPMGGIDLGAALIYASGVSSTSADTDVHAIMDEGDFRAGNILIRDDFNNYDGVSHLDVTGNGIGLQAIKVSATMKPFQALGSTHAPEFGLLFAQTAEDDADGDSDLGTEVYVNTNCTFDKNLSANIGLAFLSAGDALVLGATSPEDQFKAEFSLNYHF